jgi:hydroxymethylpyrimidine pyrophosphatase-like HAD family hydrolase
MDLDGTLIDHNEIAHPQDIALLNDFPSEVLPILATGRSLPSARGVFDHNGILQGGPFPLPGVFINGTVAQLPREKVLNVHYLDAELLPDLIELTRAFFATAFFFYQPDKVYLVNTTPSGQWLSRIHYLDAIECQPEDLPPQINKAMAVEEDLAIVDQIRDYARDFPAEMGTSLPYIFEFSPPGITKANSVRALLAEMGYAELPVYAVGDGENDLALKGMVEQFFVPSTAQKTVRDQADVVIDRAQEGILSPILDLIL